MRDAQINIPAGSYLQNFAQIFSQAQNVQYLPTAVWMLDDLNYSRLHDLNYSHLHDLNYI